MQITENQIQRFFDQQCDAEEAHTVALFLEKNPVLIRKWLEPDWKQAGKEIQVPSLYRKEMYRKIHPQLAFEKPGKNLHAQRMLMSAAAVFIFLISGWWFIKTEYKPNPTTVVNTNEIAGKTELRINLTNQPLAIVLPDQSVVTIEPGTKIKFYKGFTNKERRVFLTGNGFFEVKKNLNKPFIVESAQITTTALGTSFRVVENKDAVTVKLYSGKVVVNKKASIDETNVPVYLLPGTMLTYSTKDMKTTVAAFVPETKITKQEKETKRQIIQQTDELLFDNTHLEEVLKAIQKKYSIVINYNKEDVSGRYFTGKVLTADSAETILSVIGNINNLHIQKEADKQFSVTKNQ